jgi:hypothetical protein
VTAKVHHTLDQDAMRRFTLRSLLLLVTLISGALGLWTTEARRQERLLIEARAAVRRDECGWSETIDGQGRYAIKLHGSRLSLQAAHAVVSARRIESVAIDGLPPAPAQQALMAGFPSFSVRGRGPRCVAEMRR